MAGYLYSPVEKMLNKGVRDGDVLHGYGSATADALIGYRAMGIDPRPQDIAGLREHHAVDRNPGVGEGPWAAFAKAMKGYYRDASSTVLADIGGPPGWKTTMADAILAEQSDDGSWMNGE